MCVCVCVTAVGLSFRIVCVCVNLFAIELTTVVTVSTCSEVSLPLQQLSTPAPTLMNVIPHFAQAHSHRGASSSSYE